MVSLSAILLRLTNLSTLYELSFLKHCVTHTRLTHSLFCWPNLCVRLARLCPLFRRVVVVDAAAAGEYIIKI